MVFPLNFYVRPGASQGCPLSPLLFNLVFEVPARETRQEKRNKRHPNKKRRSKIMFADDIILYVETPEDSTKKLLELINLVKLQGTKSTYKN